MRFAATVVVTLMWSTCLAGAARAGVVPTRATGAGGTSAKVTAGVLDTLFIPVYGLDQSPGSETVASMQGAMNTVDQYYNSVSRGTTRLPTTVMNWLQIPDSLSDDCGHVDLYDLIDLATAAAQQAGQNLNAYDRVIVFAHQSPSCTWGGGTGDVLTPGVPFLPVAVNQLQAYTIIHELGHLFGVNHVHSWDCDTVFFGNCNGDEYGGRFDPMGSTWPDALNFSAPVLYKLGMLPPAEVTTATGNGTFNLSPLATAVPGAKRVLRIPSAAPGALTYTLEYRRPGGADAPLTTQAFSDWRPGVILHAIRHEGAADEVYQYDGTPGSQANDLADGGLPVGAVITDPQGLSLTVLSEGAAGATVSVQGFLSPAAPPTLSSVSFTTPNNTAAAKVRISWPNSWVSPDAASVSVETSPQVGQPVTVPASAGLADVAMPAAQGCIRYRIRAVTTNGTQGPPSAWSTPRCFFDEIQPGSLVFAAALRKTSPAGAGTTAISSTVKPAWGETNHYLPGAFEGYGYELSVQGRPVVTGSTAGTVVQTGFAPAVYPVPINTVRSGSMVLLPRSADAGDTVTTEMHFAFNGSLQVPVTSVPEGNTAHFAAIPASPYLSNTIARRLTPEESVATGCVSAGAADVDVVPFAVPTPFPSGVPFTIASPSASGQGPQFVNIRVKGNLTLQADRCLLWIDEGPTQPLNIRLIRISDDDGAPPPPPGGGNG